MCVLQSVFPGDARDGGIGRRKEEEKIKDDAFSSLLCFPPLTFRRVPARFLSLLLLLRLQ